MKAKFIKYQERTVLFVKAENESEVQPLLDWANKSMIDEFFAEKPDDDSRSFLVDYVAVGPDIWSEEDDNCN